MVVPTLARNCQDPLEVNMKRVVLTILTVAVAASPALAQTGNGAPSGPHYNLNIIGVEKGKNPPLTGSERHTIFVALGKKGMA